MSELIVKENETEEDLAKALLAEQFLKLDWESIRLPHQVIPEPENFRTVLALGGRGSGKSFLGAQTINAWANGYPGCRIALVGQTVADVRDTMIKGVSGIIATAKPWQKPIYTPSIREVAWPNGSIATTFSGDEIGQLRGPQHNFGWIDEIAKFQYATDLYDMFEMGLRLPLPDGTQPRCIITTTPKPIKIIREFIADDSVIKLIGTTFDNAANLDEAFLNRMKAKYEGTRLGQQELYALLLEDVEGALMGSDDIKILKELPEPLQFIAVGVDPFGGAKDGETGIVSVGISHTDMRNLDNLPRYYVLADNSINASPLQWANRVKYTYEETEANIIVAESNYGGSMVESTIRTIDQDLPIDMVHVRRGKLIRAEFLGAIAEQGRFYFIGEFGTLQSELTTYLPGMPSPNRLDAAVLSSKWLHDQTESPAAHTSFA